MDVFRQLTSLIVWDQEYLGDKLLKYKSEKLGMDFVYEDDVLDSIKFVSIKVPGSDVVLLKDYLFTHQTEWRRLETMVKQHIDCHSQNPLVVPPNQYIGIGLEEGGCFDVGFSFEDQVVKQFSKFSYDTEAHGKPPIIINTRIKAADRIEVTVVVR